MNTINSCRTYGVLDRLICTNVHTHSRVYVGRLAPSHSIPSPPKTSLSGILTGPARDRQRDMIVMCTLILWLFSSECISEHVMIPASVVFTRLVMINFCDQIKEKGHFAYVSKL